MPGGSTRRRWSRRLRVLPLATVMRADVVQHPAPRQFPGALGVLDADRAVVRERRAGGNHQPCRPGALARVAQPDRPEVRHARRELGGRLARPRAIGIDRHRLGSRDRRSDERVRAVEDEAAGAGGRELERRVARQQDRVPGGAPVRGFERVAAAHGQLTAPVARDRAARVVAELVRGAVRDRERRAVRDRDTAVVDEQPASVEVDAAGRGGGAHRAVVRHVARQAAIAQSSDGGDRAFVRQGRRGHEAQLGGVVAGREVDLARSARVSVERERRIRAATAGRQAESCVDPDAERCGFDVLVDDGDGVRAAGGAVGEAGVRACIRRHAVGPVGAVVPEPVGAVPGIGPGRTGARRRRQTADGRGRHGSAKEGCGDRAHRGCPQNESSAQRLTVAPFLWL